MVESCSDAMQGELKALADSLIAKADSIPVTIKDDGMARSCHFEMQDGSPTLVHFLTADISLDKVRAFFADFPTNMDKITPDNASFKVIGEVNGRTVAHHLMKPGVPLVSNRSMICTYYPVEGEGEFTFMNSTSGNEALVEQHKDKVGKDVIGTVKISYFHFKETDAGMRCTHVS